MSCLFPGLTANVAGQSYDLNDLEIRLLDYDLGLAEIRRLSQRSPSQLLGDTDLGFRVEPRILNLFWGLRGASLSNYRTIRGRFQEVFQPRDEDPVQLIFDFGDYERAVDVNLDGQLLFRDRVESIEKVSAIFKASDPRLYDPGLNTVIFDLAGSTGANVGWAIPWPIPWAIGTDIINLVKTIEYADLSRLGAIEFPIIRIIGPITDPVITNETTEELIDLTGLDLSDSSEWVEIDLSSFPRRDSKTIRDQDGESVDEYLSTGSDLATWHLAPAGERLPSGAYCSGENLIRVTGTNVDNNTQVSLRYYDRFLAV